MHLSHMGQWLAFEFSVNSTGSACEESVRLAHSVLSKCCDRQGSLRGFACSERRSTFKDTSHLQKRLPAVREQPQSSSDCGQWKAQCPSVVPCLAPHQAAGHWPGAVSWWLHKSQVSGICLMLFASRLCMNRPQSVVPEVEFYFFILSFNPRLVAHLTDGFPDLSEQLS